MAEQWYVAIDTDYDEPYVYVADDDGNEICGLGSHTSAEAMGLARLIAAAPELLAACEAFIDAFRVGDISILTWNGRGPIAFEAAEKAIAKARGTTYD